VKAELTPVARVLLWDLERGSLAYDLVCLALLLIVLALPPGSCGDPMAARP
jgi:hypothetical protein